MGLPSYYTVDEVASAFRLSPYTIRRHIRSGDFGPTRGRDSARYVLELGGQWRLSQLAIEHFTERVGTRAPTRRGENLKYGEQTA